ncbi:MAG: P-type conjugative transfer protein TrbG [Synergistaceae bacterium]|nr:P-type conjugative transfer protein TrbG [Synergistaceae bacterium]
MNRKYYLALLGLIALLLLVSGGPGECSEIWESVSLDYRMVVASRDEVESGETQENPVFQDDGANPDVVEIEYDGRIISVDIRDLIFIADSDGRRKLELNDASKYEVQLENAPIYGVGAQSYENAVADDSFSSGSGMGPNRQEITEREYEEQRRARQWAEVIEDLTLREIDEKAMDLVREFSGAKDAVPPITGVAGSVVITWSSYTPRVVCRPMHVTDIILQPGEIVTGVHPGDPVRWTFVPSISGAGDTAQTHVLIKPLAADISTNVVINTDRRTYQLDLMSDSRNFIPSVSFSYPGDTLKGWDSFIAERNKESERGAELASGYSVSPEDLYLDYEIRGKDSLRWKPVRVWDDGVKTYIQFRNGSMKRSVEAPVLVVFEHKKEVLVNYRAAEDMYIVDRVFDIGALIVGIGAHQDRVVIKRLAAGQASR